MAKKSNVNIPAIQVIRLIVFLFIGVIIFTVYSKTVEFIRTSPMFRVHDVLIDSSVQFIDVAELRRLKGRNIFAVDIDKLEARIKGQYPQLADLRVIRELPDRIKVLAKKREVLFQTVVKGKLLLVDVNGVAMFYTAANVNIPLVQGLGASPAKIVLGARLPNKSVHSAIDILNAFKSHALLSHLKLTSIDVENPSKVDIVLAEGPHVLLDAANFASKLDLLEMMVAQKKIDFIKVKYIDLRFNEPVLGDNNV